MKSIVAGSTYWLSGAAVVSTALVPVFGVLALAGLIPLNFYYFFCISGAAAKEELVGAAAR